MGTYIRLVDINDAKGKESAFLSAVQDKNSSIRFETSAENFSKIPGSPLAYWISEKVIKAFEVGELLGNIAYSKQGLATTDNKKYLRFWHEVFFANIGFGYTDIFEATQSETKWFPYNKGGEFRKWYGNDEYIVNYSHDGTEIKADVLRKYPYLKTPDFVVKNTQYYFHRCFSWSLVSSGVAAFRYKPQGYIFDVAGMSCFTKDNLEYLLALCNTNIVMEILKVLAPTINYQCGDIANIPVIIDETKKPTIETLVEENINVSKTDWDSFETSWCFKRHPLLCGEGTVAATFAKWEREVADRFDTLKANEEELNRIFIDIYGLQDELTPDVEEKDVTVRKADLGQDIRSFISYAVGCMLGRYSLDVEGLAYAGGDWDPGKYKTYTPDADNCIPITEEEYFDDDVVSRFVDFVKAVYGKDTLEKNLEFIAEALGNRGDTPLKTIRNYFINDFYKDHVKIYQKRPIYWLFDSGKENGFKALIYMHRYNADTIGNMRIEYIHKLQAKYESQLSFEQHLIDTSQNQREKSAAMKQKEKLIRQIKEIKDYDVKIAHLANCRIEIDLDDGVKVNYEKVQTGKDGKKLEVLGKI